MPSPAPTVTLVLTPGTASSIVALLAAPTRLGTNNVTLGWPLGGTQDLAFSIVAENGVSSPTFTVRIVLAAPRSGKSWTLIVSPPGMVPMTLTDASIASAGIIRLPALLAFANVPLALTISPGATVSPTQLNPILPMGSPASSNSYSFVVTAEDLSTSVPFTLQLSVASTNATTWLMQVSGAGISPFALTSATADPLTVVQLPYTTPVPIAIDNSSVTYWLTGVNCATQPNSVGSSGIYRIANDSNTPAGREGAVTWTGLDGSAKRLATPERVWCG
jgi:hypothetical protein